MRIIGLTGGIGSGKSEAAKRFESHGLPVIEADKLGHELLMPDHPVAQTVVETFGPDILTDGIIDRAKLGAVVFGETTALARLNALTHPALKAEIRRRCATFETEGRPAAIVDAAIIGEDGTLDEWLDGLILVLCRADLRVQRLTAQRGMPPGQAQARVEAQTPPERKIPLATWVIYNERSLKELHKEVDRVAEEILVGHGCFR